MTDPTPPEDSDDSWEDTYGHTPGDDPSKFDVRLEQEIARVKGEEWNGNDYGNPEEYQQVDEQDKDDILRYWRTIRSTSSANQRNHVRHLRQLAQDKQFDGPLVDQDADTLDDLVYDMSIDRDWGEGTERNHAISLAAFLRARRQNDVADRINIPEVEEEGIDPDDVLSPAEIVALRDAATRPRDKAFITAMWESGNRINSMSALKVKHYNDDNDGYGMLTVPDAEGDKDAGGHIKPIIFARSDMDRWMAEHPLSNAAPEDFQESALFPSIRPQDPDGAHVSPHGWRQLLKRIANRADDLDPDDIHPHAFRHSRASYMRGVEDFDSIDIEQTMAWVEGTTQHSRYENTEQKEMAKRLLRKQGIETEETEKEQIMMNCPRCGEKTPAFSDYCANCQLRLEDAIPKWWQIYRQITRTSDPIQEFYSDDVPPANVAELQPAAYEHVAERLATASVLFDAKNRPDDPLSDSIDTISESMPVKEVDISSLETDDVDWIEENLYKATDQHLDEHPLNEALKDPSNKIISD